MSHSAPTCHATLELDLAPVPATAAAAPSGALHTGFEIGWDHAQHGLVPPPELLVAVTPVGQGWRAARAVCGPRPPATRAVQQWLALRTRAWREGAGCDAVRVAPPALAQLQTDHCPIRRVPFAGGASHPDACVVDRIDDRAGYVAGNLVLLSERAAQARAGVDGAEALRRARRAAADGEPVAGLDAAAWWRLAALRSFVTPLALHEAARVPLALLPPPGVGICNVVQSLQALLTLQFAAPGWAARTRAAAELLPEPALRQDYNLFIGALAPRVLEAAAEPPQRRAALEDAWLDARVQRRWQQLVLNLGDERCETLLRQAAAQGLGDMRRPTRTTALRDLRRPAASATSGRLGARTRRAPARPPRAAAGPQGRPPQ